MARHQTDHIEYLKKVNRALMERLGTKGLRFTDAERRKLGVLGKKLGRKALAELATIATPETILRWYRELVAKKYDGSARRGHGRPRTAAVEGPGRVDVSTTSGTEPVRLPDLRPVRFLTHLHHDATLSVHGVSTLAIRIETLVITSYGQVIRPPRIIALALAAYIDSLANVLPPVSAAETASPRGSVLFGVKCGSCHAPPEFTGDPIPLAIGGTDSALGSSAERGTGMYRVPSLRGVGSRKFLLHDGTVSSLEAMFDPTRPTAEFTSRMRGPGAVPGHLFGLDLSDDDRQALLSFLRAL